LGVLGLPAENKLLEPDTCNQVVGKVMVSETHPLVPNPAHFPLFVHPVNLSILTCCATGMVTN
jgi:hypothetical protein